MKTKENWLNFTSHESLNCIWFDFLALYSICWMFYGVTPNSAAGKHEHTSFVWLLMSCNTYLLTHWTYMVHTDTPSLSLFITHHHTHQTTTLSAPTGAISPAVFTFYFVLIRVLLTGAKVWPNKQRDVTCSVLYTWDIAFKPLVNQCQLNMHASYV